MVPPASSIPIESERHIFYFEWRWLSKRWENRFPCKLRFSLDKIFYCSASAYWAYLAFSGYGFLGSPQRELSKCHKVTFYTIFILVWALLSIYLYVQTVTTIFQWDDLSTSWQRDCGKRIEEEVWGSLGKSEWENGLFATKGARGRMSWSVH